MIKGQSKYSTERNETVKKRSKGDIQKSNKPAFTLLMTLLVTFNENRRVKDHLTRSFENPALPLQMAMKAMKDTRVSRGILKRAGCVSDNMCLCVLNVFV